MYGQGSMSSDCGSHVQVFCVHLMYFVVHVPSLHALWQDIHVLYMYRGVVNGCLVRIYSLNALNALSVLFLGQVG